MEILGVSNITYLYTLNDPTTGEVRYVGKSDTPYKRFTQHLSKSKKNNTYKNNWISSLINEGKKPILQIIDVVETSQWGFWESYWISLFKTWGFKLTNLTNGGDGGNFGTEVNKKISEKLKGRVYSEETIKRMRLGAQKRRLTKEGRKRLSKHRMGEKNSMYGKKQSKHCIELKYKPIIQMDGDNNIIKSWVSMKSVTDELGINRNGLRMVCNGDRKSAGGFKWKWKNEQV